VDGWRPVSSQRTSEFDKRREIPLTPDHKVATPEVYFTKMLVEASQLIDFIVIMSMPEALLPSVVIHIHSRHVTNYSVVVV
jgi:hypothetical protein